MKSIPGRKVDVRSFALPNFFGGRSHHAILGLVLAGLISHAGPTHAQAVPPPPSLEGTFSAGNGGGAAVPTAMPAPPRQALKEVVQQSVLTQPEVAFRWHAFLAADREHSAAIGGYFPKLDLTAGRAKERRDDPVLLRDYSRKSSSLTLTQMLYDGFFTRNEVHRLDHARMTRLFELHDASETTALEAVRAYLDVLRYRKLLNLTEENYVRHRSVLEQIQLKVKAGVGRRVDLEQASGRFALAESNLLIETSNLHDVTARFQRLVGVSPAAELEEPPDLNKDLPPNPNAAQARAQLSNPALRASIENLRSAESALATRAAAYQPRFDFRLRNDRGTDLNGLLGSTDNRVAEVVMTWNLFNGFSDVNRSRQFAEQRNVAKDLRDKACRDMRQTLAIAYNDARKLNEQLNYLDQHQLSIEKARDAYRKQFDIGQRTLLDVLDTENELFQAKRAYTNAEYDLKLAYARTQAGMGKLIEVIGLSRLDAEEKKLSEQWAAEGDGAQQCPAEAPILYLVDKSALDARAAEMLRELAPKTVDGETPSATLSGAGIPAPNGNAEAMQAIGLALKSWAATWTGKNVQGYLDSYASTFIPADGSDLETWKSKRKAALARAGDISIEITDVKIELRDPTHAVSTFTQAYRSNQFQDVVQKTLEWEKIGGRWLIVGEASVKAPRLAAQRTVVPGAPAGAAAPDLVPRVSGGTGVGRSVGSASATSSTLAPSAPAPHPNPQPTPSSTIPSPPLPASR